MPAPISIVIPTLNSETDLYETLGSLFEGVENNYELLLAIRNTNIDTLPDGFHKMFKNIVHFSLDIRDNKFESIAPTILYGNKSHWEHTGTKSLQGELKCFYNTVF